MAKGAALRTFAPTLILLALAVLINYIDRGNLSLLRRCSKSNG